MNHRAVAAAFVALLLPAASAEAGEIRQRTTYFDVEGSTLAALDEELRRRGPVVGGGGERHPGATRVRFDGHVTYATDPRGCRVDETDLSLDLEITLPRWNAPRSTPPETVRIWDVLAADVERHELRHAEIAREWRQRLEGALRNLRPQRSCAAMEESVRATTTRYLAAHERAQLDFDLVEGREVGYRLRRALRDSER